MSPLPRPDRRVLAATVAALTLALTAGTGAGLAAASAGPAAAAVPAAGDAADVPQRPSLLDPAQPEPPDDDGAHPGDEPADEPAEEPTDEPAEEPAEEPTEEPTDDPADEPADVPADDPSDEPADEPADEPEAPGTDPADEPAPGGDKPADRPGAMPAITVEGDQILRGGEPWWFLGYNSFVWSANCGHDDEKMSEADVEEWFASMRHDGHGAVRLFFYDGWDIDRLDAAVESAQRHNVYLTITLDDAIGGCGENDKTAEWFADQGERDVYRAHMEMLLERYRGDTTFAWFEFFNEPDYEGGALREFFDEMGATADAVDPDRLFSSGTVAPYWVDGEDNFADIHESPGVDVASLHEYDEGEIESNHGPKVRANSAGKPVIVGEFGIEVCEGEFGSRAERFARKAEVYTDTTIGYVGAFAWAWQPGGGGCELGNLDADGDTQQVLRDHLLDDALARAGQTVDDAADDAAEAVDEAVERLTEGAPDLPLVG